MRLEGLVERVRRESWRSLVCWGSESVGRFEEAFGEELQLRDCGGDKGVVLHW